MNGENINWLNNNTSKNAKVCVHVARHLTNWYRVRDDISFNYDGKPDYLVLLNRKSFLSKNEIDIMANTMALHPIGRFGSTLSAVYKYN